MLLLFMGCLSKDDGAGSSILFSGGHCLSNLLLPALAGLTFWTGWCDHQRLGKTLENGTRVHRGIFRSHVACLACMLCLFRLNTIWLQTCYFSTQLQWPLPDRLFGAAPVHIRSAGFALWQVGNIVNACCGVSNRASPAESTQFVISTDSSYVIKLHIYQQD